MTAMRTVTEREEDIFRMTEFNDLVANADIISKKSCVNARKLSSYLFLPNSALELSSISSIQLLVFFRSVLSVSVFICFGQLMLLNK